MYSNVRYLALRSSFAFDVFSLTAVASLLFVFPIEFGKLGGRRINSFPLQNMTYRVLVVQGNMQTNTFFSFP